MPTELTSQLRQIAAELDEVIQSRPRLHLTIPCHEANVIREAANELDRLRGYQENAADRIDRLVKQRTLLNADIARLQRMYRSACERVATVSAIDADAVARMIDEGCPHD